MADTYADAEMAAHLEGKIAVLDAVTPSIETLVAKAKALVDMLDDAERNHGGLYSTMTMTAANELRLELSRWK